MLAQWRAEATREREEMRADLRARAERAGREADAYRAELAQLRTGTGPDGTSVQATAGARRCARIRHMPNRSGVQLAGTACGDFRR